MTKRKTSFVLLLFNGDKYTNKSVLSYRSISFFKKK